MRWAFVSWALSGLLFAGQAGAQRAAEIVPPAPESAIEVPYPAGAHGDAEVELELSIAADGTVENATVRAGDAPFAEAARRAAERLRFSPATRNGIPVRARIALRIGFREPAPEAPAPEPARPALPESAAPAASSAPPPASPAASVPGDAPAPSAEVVVLGERRSDLGSIQIPKEEARRVPGAFADPFRVVEALPGVAPVLSGLPYYFVRGAPPGDVGYFIDGIRVPLLFHVGPGPSVIAPALIDRVDLFPGAYPARFGRYAGAILAGETGPPSERPRGEGQARIFDASAMVEQPFADGRASVVGGARYSYTQALLAAVAPDYELGYGDYQARLSYAFDATDRVTLFSFGGFDRLHNREIGHTLFDVEFHRVDLRWDRASEEGRARLGLTFSSDRVLAAPEEGGSAGSAQRTRGLGLRAEIEHDLWPALRLRAGANFGFETVRGDREQLGDDGFRAFADRTDLSGAAFADLVFRPARSAEIVPGVRVARERSRGESFTFVEPRLATRTRVVKGVAYLAGFGVAHQLPALTVRMPGRTPNLLELSEQEAFHASQGVEYVLPDAMLGRTTLFYQFVDVDQPGAHGRSYGVEQFVRRNFTHRLGGFLSYTLSRAEGIVGRETAVSSYDRTHVFSAVLGYDLGAGFRAGARAYYASGRADFVACPTPDCGPGDPLRERPFVRRVRLPSFFRLDTRIEKTWRFDGGAWLTATFEWFNALLAREAQDVFYSAEGLTWDSPSPLTLPSIGVEFGY